MGAKRARGRATVNDDVCGRPTEPVPMRIPPEAFRSVRPLSADDAGIESTPGSSGYESGTLRRSIHDAVTVPPPAATSPSDRVPPTVPSPGTVLAQTDALAEIDDAWD